jgi:VanZ like family
MFNRTAVIYYIPFFVIMLVIFVLSILSSGSMTAFQFTDLLAVDKVGHFFAYGSLSFFYYFGVRRTRHRIPNRNEIFVIIAVCAAYGILLELCQLYVFTSRSYEFADMIANTLGAASGVMVARLFWR